MTIGGTGIQGVRNERGPRGTSLRRRAEGIDQLPVAPNMGVGHAVAQQRAGLGLRLLVSERQRHQHDGKRSVSAM